MSWRSSFKIVLPLLVVCLFLFSYDLNRQSSVFAGLEVVLLSLRWLLLLHLIAWIVFFLYLSFSLDELPLIGLLFIAVISCFVAYSQPWEQPYVLTLLAGVSLGKGTRWILMPFRNSARASSYPYRPESDHVSFFLIGLVLLFVFASFWHLDKSDNAYRGPRWMGLWDNPNIYGMLMSAGLTLAVGLLFGRKNERGRMKPGLAVVLIVAALIMGTGLLFSYSRGAWLGAAVGLAYVLRIYNKIKWKFVLPLIVIVVAGVSVFWNATADSAQWYVKRLDLGRPSAQHRVTAWKAGLEIMRSHPFGVGWGKTEEIYEKEYSPPDNGAGAITTNDYLMLGTQLGIPALLCFLAYIVLCFRRTEMLPGPIVACRAAALTMLVAFWFDGGLFKLATASMFWILLELGASPPKIRQPFNLATEKAA